MPNLFSFARQKKNPPRNPYPPSPNGSDRRSSILSKWKDLKDGPIDRQQLAPLIDVKANRNIALQLSGKDATVVINKIDKALKQIDHSGETRLNALKVLRKLAGNTCQVPKSYLVGRWTRYTVKEEIIARGGFADVREGRLGDKAVAIKTLRTSKETKVHDIHKAFCKESVAWMNVSHPNILKLIAVDINPRSKKFSMISEMMTNGNIMKYISAKRADRLCLLRDVAGGLEYLHGLGIVHGDLKGANILVDNQTPPQACISDFGLCAIAPWMSFDPTTHSSGRGTFGYMAPELYERGSKHTKEADIYAFGIVVYEVITGNRSFGQHRLLELPMLTTSGSRPSRPADPVADGFGQGTWEFIERCWSPNSQRRPTAREASEHFEHVRATSRVVDPSSVPPARRADGEASSELDSGTRSISKLLAQQSHSGSSRLRQTGFAARAFIDPGSVRSPAPIPPTVKGKRSLLGRLRLGIVNLRLLPSSLRGNT